MESLIKDLFDYEDIDDRNTYSDTWVLYNATLNRNFSGIEITTYTFVKIMDDRTISFYKDIEVPEDEKEVFDFAPYDNDIKPDYTRELKLVIPCDDDPFKGETEEETKFREMLLKRTKEIFAEQRKMKV